MSKKAELIGSHFPTIYLTIISLLQGIALSQLVPIIITYFEMAEQPWTSIHGLPLLLMLLVIFIVWHHYAIGIFFLRWFPNIIDTIIPFFISIGQFFLVSFLTIKTSVSDMDVETWTKGFSLFIMMGSIAYFSAAWRLDPDSFTNIMSRQNAIEHCRRGKKFYTWSACSVLLQGMFGLLIIWLQREQLLMISFMFLLIHLILSEYLLLKMIKPHFVRALNEFDE